MEPPAQQSQPWLQAALKMTRSLLENPVPESLASIVADALVGLVQSTVAVLVPEPGEQTLRVEAAAGAEADRFSGAVVSAPLSMTGWALRTGEAVYCGDVTADPRTEALGRLGFDRGSAASIPVKVNGQTACVLLVVYPEAGEHLRQVLPDLQHLTEMAGLVMEQGEVRREAGKQVRHLLALHEVSRLLALTLDASTVLTLSVDVATGLFDLDLCCVLLQEGDLFQVAAARGLDPALAPNLICPAGQVPDFSRLGLDGLAVVHRSIQGRQGSIGYLVVGRRNQPVMESEQRLLAIWASLAGAVIENARLLAETEQARQDVLSTLISAVESAGSGAQGHSRQVAELAVATARRMGLEESAILDIEAAALLHDLGSFLLPQAMGQVDHAVAGATVLSGSRYLSRVAPLVRHHPEHWDGSGQPDGLRGEQIPLGARILAVVEAFVELTETTEQRPGRNPVAALLQLKAESGRRFDPAVVVALESVAWARLNMVSSLASPPLAGTGPAEAEPAPIAATAADQVPDLSVLTTREREILGLIGQGFSNREIAARLYLSEATVKTHVSRILQKLELPDRTKAAVYLMRGHVPNR